MSAQADPAPLWKRLRKPPPLLVDVAIVLGILYFIHLTYWLSLTQFLTSLDWYGNWAVVGLVALLFRRTFPLMVFIATLPSAMADVTQPISVVAMYTLAAHTRHRLLTPLAAMVLACVYIWPQRASLTDNILYPDIAFQLDTSMIVLVSTIGVATIPALLGKLVQTKRDLSLRLSEITEAREHEQLLMTQSALASERAQLAREMHDVVSHQVSLIAVQAGALQVTATDPSSKESASAIRRLSVRTLDELRHMVSVLRASGSKPTELSPQPTLQELEQLVDNCGLEAQLECSDLPVTDSPTQRAIYRAVQEALTNARKHAPGSTATVRIDHNDDEIRVEIVNTAATRPVVPLPSSQHGLLGLRQRAELIGGSMESGATDEGGWRVSLTVPVTPPESKPDSVPSATGEEFGWP